MDDGIQLTASQSQNKIQDVNWQESEGTIRKHTRTVELRGKNGNARN
jgi:hypothetical protein